MMRSVNAPPTTLGLAAPEPQLARPGAGLPKAELYVARILFGLRRWTGSRDAFNAAFVRERRAIQQLVVSCDSISAGRRVLIPRVRGLEDSSRYWSVWMTLEHLRIVNSQITKVIALLAAGKTPSGTASTAAVKPSPLVNDAVVGKYEAACEALVNTIAGIPNLKTGVRFAHPWFGPLDGSGWHALAGSHMKIHRVQIQRILAGL